VAPVHQSSVFQTSALWVAFTTGSGCVEKICSI
jgi:hypothetical protein